MKKILNACIVFATIAYCSCSGNHISKAPDALAFYKIPDDVAHKMEMKRMKCLSEGDCKIPGKYFLSTTAIDLIKKEYDSSKYTLPNDTVVYRKSDQRRYKRIWGVKNKEGKVKNYQTIICKVVSKDSLSNNSIYYTTVRICPPPPKSDCKTTPSGFHNLN